MLFCPDLRQSSDTGVLFGPNRLLCASMSWFPFTYPCLRFVAQDHGCCQQLFHLHDGEDVGNPGCLGRLDQGDIFPGLVQYPGIEELQAVEIVLDRAPGMRVQGFREIIKQLLG